MGQVTEFDSDHLLEIAPQYVLMFLFAIGGKDRDRLWHSCICIGPEKKLFVVEDPFLPNTNEN